jgi:NAD(P)-dependent dehydrogenase (short-subunit alcohol dehydrogenase family)
VRPTCAIASRFERDVRGRNRLCSVAATSVVVMIDVRPLEGLAALVTGGGTGIGLACAQRLARDGAAVTICGRRGDVLEAALATLGDAGRMIVCDVTDDAQVAAAVAFAAERLGRLDVAVANAGGASTAGPIVMADLAGWNQTLTLNVMGTLSVIKHCGPKMAQSGGGSIVALSSIAGHMTHRNLGAYAVAKAGIEMLVRNAADELGRFGVRVNGVRPGLVPTDISAGLNNDEATRQDYLDQMPLGRTGTVEDIAAAVRFLAGPEASWITGQLLGVDGGHSLRRGPDLGNLFDPAFGEPLRALMNPPR